MPVKSPSPADRVPKVHDRRTAPDVPGYGATRTLLRQPASPSYDPNTGRSASSVDDQDARAHVHSGNHARPDRQLPKECGFQARDRAYVQSPVPVSKRPIG
jgi:hypothetical protein